MIAGMFVHDLRIQRATQTTDRYGNLVDTWTSPDEVEVRGWINQTGQQELLEQRNGQVVDAVAFLPAGTDIVPGDRVVWVDQGLTFEVDGRPASRWRPQSGEHHIETALRAVEG